MVAPDTADSFDLIVVGAGINGSAIARDAALRGLRTCLVEQDDLCAGTTRWSSRLIHGGLRYLEHGELGLVHESLRERETLLRIAPHLVRPLPLLIPVYAHSRRGLNTVSFGLWLYDLLASGRSLPGYRRLSAEELLERAPGLARGQLDGGVLYYDAQLCFVERLVVEQALAAREAGASIRTYTRVERLLVDAGRMQGVRVHDRRADCRQELRAPLVVNAAGPWVDRLLHTLPRRPARQMGPTRGTHIVVPRFTGAPEVACYLEAHSDGRPFFVLPWNGMVLIGTTDIRDDRDPGQVQPTRAEIDYLLAETRAVFPGAELDHGRILYHYAGLRPLPRQGRRLTGSITRRHLIRHHAPLARGLYSVIGGKITTCRSLAEEVVDQIVRRTPAAAGQACRTAALPLPGSGERGAVLAALGAWTSLSAASREHLWEVYGARASAVAALTDDDPALAQPICPFSHAIGAEVLYGFSAEGAQYLSDVLFRRCMAGLGPDLGRAAMEAALAVGARHLGWDAARQAAERERCRRERRWLAAPMPELPA